MIGRAVWWLVCRAVGAHHVSEEMLDALLEAVPEMAAELGVVAEEDS